MAVWAGRNRVVLSSSFTATVIMSIAWSVDAATDTENDGLWPIGTMLVAGATLSGFALVSAVASRYGRRTSPPLEASDQHGDGK